LVVDEIGAACPGADANLRSPPAATASRDLHVKAATMS